MTPFLTHSALYLLSAIVYECPNSEYETYALYSALKTSNNGPKKQQSHNALCRILYMQ